MAVKKTVFHKDFQKRLSWKSLLKFDKPTQ